MEDDSHPGPIAALSERLRMTPQGRHRPAADLVAGARISPS